MLQLSVRNVSRLVHFGTFYVSLRAHFFRTEGIRKVCECRAFARLRGHVGVALRENWHSKKKKIELRLSHRRYDFALASTRRAHLLLSLDPEESGSRAL